MDRSLPMLLIGLVFGGLIGFTIAAANGIVLDGHDHGDPTQHHAGHAAAHDHATLLSLPDNALAPRLALEARPDPATGWNLHLLTENFTFAPENASLAHVSGQGHAHVYVNGVKLGRFYGPWVHLDNLPPGEVRVEVTLNANDHRPLAVTQNPVAKTILIRN